jgi:hypothetical protein
VSALLADYEPEASSVDLINKLKMCLSDAGHFGPKLAWFGDYERQR